eukprot:183365-Amphidinium_carterae.1
MRPGHLVVCASALALKRWGIECSSCSLSLHWHKLAALALQFGTELFFLRSLGESIDHNGAFQKASQTLCFSVRRSCTHEYGGPPSGPFRWLDKFLQYAYRQRDAVVTSQALFIDF